MIPSFAQGPGGQIYYFDGGAVELVNLTLVSDPTESLSIGAANTNKSSPNLGYNEFFFGGINSYWPASYANHKPAAFYLGKLYMGLNNVKDSLGHLYIGRWDGSGIFKHGGSAYGTSPGRCGRGFEFLCPSGNHDVKSSDLGFLVHNSNLFIVGQHWGNQESPGANLWLTRYKWHWYHNAFGATPTRKQRRYRVASIDKNGKKIMGPPTTFTGDASQSEHTHCCDLISYGNDIYFASWVDLLRIHGGSGQIQLIEKTINIPSAKSFAIWPSGGYIEDEPQSERRLLMLSESGVLKRVHASGTHTIADFALLRNNIRTGDNFSARISSATLEPGRSCLLIKHNNVLHSFTPTATSGYMHFYCSGSPSGNGNWTDISDDMPVGLKANDGNIFGYVDEKRNKLYLAHFSMSKCGAYGHQGIQTSAGGINIYEMDTNNNFTSIYGGMVGSVPRGLIPYQNLGPYALIPSGTNPTVFKCSDYAIIQYKLYDHYRRNVDVDIEYSADAGLSWHTAKRFATYNNATLLGDGITNLTTSPEGKTYNFYWDYVDNGLFNIVKEALIRIRPRLTR